MISREIEIIDNDKMLQDLSIKSYKKYDSIFQKEMELCTIIKYVYKTDNAVFNQKEDCESPKLKCVFSLHSEKRSSFVTVYNNKNEIIFEGNYLWANPKASSCDDFLLTLKRLHDFKSVVKNFSQ